MDGGPTRSSGAHRSTRWWARRFVIASVVAVQITAVVAAYGTTHTPLGWQMFPASDEWEAEIVRVTVDGERRDIRDPWPGGVQWSTVVRNHGLADPFRRHPATYGIETTLDFLEGALEWVAHHTPDDSETIRLEAVVTYWENGRGPHRAVLVSSDREEAAR